MNIEQDLEQLESMDTSFLDVSVKSGKHLFQCGVYIKSYKTKAALRRQLQLHSSDFICRKCLKSFTSELDLENHKSKKDSEKEMMVRLP